MPITGGQMRAEHIRDAAATVAVFGFFASSWFGWAQEAPPRDWRRLLMTGAIAALLAVAAGALLVWLHWGDGTAFDEDTGRAFGVVVGIEFGVAALGAVVLAVRRHRALIAVWIALVVGVHLFPVAVLIEYPAVHVVAALVTVSAVAAVPVARSRSITPSAVVGLAVGSILLVAALFSLATVAFGY
jgi:hypothetical protein